MLISIVIPTFEESGLKETLEYLVKQTVFDKYPNQVEIIVADFDPNAKSITWNSWAHTDIQLKFLLIDRTGIAYARHKGIVSSSGQIIVNFDADAKFSREDAIEMLIAPLLNNNSGIVVTCCDNIFDNAGFGNQKEDLLVRITGVGLYETLNGIQRDAPVVVFEPGMCFRRDAYDYSGGFLDVRQAEAIVFSPKLIYNYGLLSKKYIKDVAVIVSPRRVNAMFKFGALAGLNYDNAFRD